MRRIEETHLPGVGQRWEFQTRDGMRLGVLEHRGGLRDLLIYDRADPDTCAETIRLTEDDARTLAELLGAPTVIESGFEARQSLARELVIDWVQVGPEWPCAGEPLRRTGLREHTRVSVVAVVREGEMTPTPSPDFVLATGDILVVVGAPGAVDEAARLLRSR